jgi:acetoacetyl-CoA synthetase
VLGISPRYIQTLLQAAYIPCENHHLASLRLVLTTGAPLSIDHHDFIKQRVGENIFLFNGSGGTGSLRQLQLLSIKSLIVPSQMSVIITSVRPFQSSCLNDLIPLTTSGGSVTLPHYYGELQMPMLGSKIECWDDNGVHCCQKKTRPDLRIVT